MANGFLGFCNAGPCINHIDVAPNFAGILLGITDTWGTVAGILAPILVGFLTENEVGNYIEIQHCNFLRLTL